MFSIHFPVFLLLSLGLTCLARAQGDTLGLKNGFLNLSLANLDLQLAQDAQVLVSLKATVNSTRDFLPFDYLTQRAGNGQYHWGDITLRYRAVGSSAWIDGDSAQARKPVTSITPRDSSVLASSELSPTFDSSTALSITREWLDLNGDLGLSFTISNPSTCTAIEIGSLGFPAEFNSIFTNRTAAQTQEICSLSDPYIGMHGGYIRTVPISGNGAALVVTPLYNSTPFEAYRNLDEPSYPATQYLSQTFEGFYEWQVFSKAYAENEWNASTPWNTPSSLVLGPGDSRQFGLRFSAVSQGIRGIDDAVQATGTPFVRGIPGFIIPQDLPAQLMVKPGNAGGVSNVTVEPTTAFAVKALEPGLYELTPSVSAFGRALVTLTYSSGLVQTVHYFITASGLTTMANMGNFLTTEQYYNDTSDPFGRAPSVISYDYSVKAQVLQDPRVWIAGLSDEAGAGSYLAATMKQAVHPNAEEVSKLEAFVDDVLFKTLQPNNGNYSVRKSIFYYGLPGFKYSTEIDWSNWWSWNQAEAYSTDRAYDYVHVIAAYWALYRAGRVYSTILSAHAWDWYLNQSYQTAMTCFATNSSGAFLTGYADVGLMEETVIGELLKDLYRENLTTEASTLEAKMKARADLWNTQADPFGSEMAWDSTGQEGVYYWSKYFDYPSTVAKTLGTVLGFQPTIPHWGWNGNARRYWDNIYGGKLQRIERQIHHYGSGLNALVALSAFRSDPSDTYLLRIGYGGMNGPLSNIHSDGFAAASFHSYPETLEWDAYSGDYGPNFVGLVLGSAAYLVEDSDLGIVAYGGVITSSASSASVVMQPRDAFRRRVFIAMVGLTVEIDAGAILEVTYSPADKSLEVALGQLDGAPAVSKVVMWVNSESDRKGASAAGVNVIGDNVTISRLGWAISVNAASTSVTIVTRQA